jgi:hypothetical protein
LIFVLELKGWRTWAFDVQGQEKKVAQVPKESELAFF